MECFNGLSCSLASSWVLPMGWPRKRTEWGGESKFEVFIHHHSPLSPSPSHPEAFLQVNPLSVTFLLQSLVTALFSHPFGSGSGNSSMLLSSGNYTISVVPLHPTHTMEHYAFIIPSLDSTTLSVSFVSCWGLDSYTGLRLFLVWRVAPPASPCPPWTSKGQEEHAPQEPPLTSFPALPFSPHSPFFVMYSCLKVLVNHPLLLKQEMTYFIIWNESKIFTSVNCLIYEDNKRAHPIFNLKQRNILSQFAHGA